MPAVTLDDLRRHAVARTLFAPTTLARAIAKLGFVQADPIRAPARAQDLTLRHRVKGYQTGELERRYARLPVEEDYLVNYGYLRREHLALMHPRQASRVWDAPRRRRAADVLAFVAERGSVHPRDVQAQFDHGRTRNAWGGQSNAVTELLEGMHYRGLLRVARREGGQRIYAPAHHAGDPRSPAERADALVDLIVAAYAPLPSRGLGLLCSALRYGAPQFHASGELRAAQQRARQRLPGTELAGQHWFWPDGENPGSRRHAPDDTVRLLAPFDPIVWDRGRFETLWGWAYRFEAYTPPARRLRGYYALPLLWRDQVIGWANVGWRDGRLTLEIGYVAGAAPREPAYRAALDDELQRLLVFLDGDPKVQAGAVLA